MEILVILIFIIGLYIIYLTSNTEISSKSTKSGSLFPKKRGFTEDDLAKEEFYLDDDLDHTNKPRSSINFDSDDSNCSSSRAFWDPTCPLYHVLHSDDTTSTDYMTSTSSFDDDYYYFSSRFYDDSSSSSWDSGWTSSYDDFSSSSWDDTSYSSGFWDDDD